MRKNHFSSCFAVAVLGLSLSGSSHFSHAQTVTVLYNFGSKTADPQKPLYSGIIAQGRDGNLYSTAPQGGTLREGGAFKITTGGKETVLYNFDGDHGIPWSGLTLGPDGWLYGTTEGGATGGGTVFRLSEKGGTPKVLHGLNGSDEEGVSQAPPICATDGNFYGTTFGLFGQDGTVYKVTPSGKFTTLHTFHNTDGKNSSSPLVQGTDGNFYGTTVLGGANFLGVVFKITPGGKYTLLYSFDGTHGSEPWSGLIQASDGNFYGTTYTGGATNSGVIFKMTPAGKFTVLHSMNGTTDGAFPFAALVEATDGNFYGANSDVATAGAGTGTLFRITPTGHFKALYTFSGNRHGEPFITLVQHTNGKFYGETEFGGTANAGKFYSLDVGLKPFVALVSTSGKLGKSIGILGQGFKGTTSVSFNGTAAAFKVVSDTYLTAIVPQGATSGGVTVVTSDGKLTSNKVFRVVP
jgi:uncharacterized repeat protein (TIGR03803 family)